MDVVSVVVDAGVWDVEDDAEEIAVLDIGSAAMLEIKEKDWDEEELAVLDICSAAALEIEEEDFFFISIRSKMTTCQKLVERYSFILKLI